MRTVFVLMLISMTTACKSTPEDDIEYFPEGVEGFDASVPDGGIEEPVAECLDGYPRFNNNFSPAFGGKERVDVEVVAFVSFYCPHCADFAAYSKGLWRDRTDFQDRARLYIHHASYYFRHRAAVAAMNQGEGYFWELHDYIYGGLLMDAPMPDEEIIAFVQDDLKLDMDRFNADLESDETYAFLKWDYTQGKNAGVTATPTVLVCGKAINWTKLGDKVADEL